LDIALKIKAKHGKLYQYMVDNNLSWIEMSSRLGVSSNTLGNILHFRWYPKKNTRGSYNTGKIAKKLESFFGCSIEELFPKELQEKLRDNEEIRKLLQDTHVIHKEIDIEYLPFYSLPQIPYVENFDSFETNDLLKNILKTLTPKEEKVIKMRFGIGDKEYSLSEIAKDFDVSRERIRQIEEKALRKLRHPSRKIEEA